MNNIDVIKGNSNFSVNKKNVIQIIWIVIVYYTMIKMLATQLQALKYWVAYGIH